MKDIMGSRASKGHIFEEQKGCAGANVGAGAGAGVGAGVGRGTNRELSEGCECMSGGELPQAAWRKCC